MSKRAPPAGRREGDAPGNWLPKIAAAAIAVAALAAYSNSFRGSLVFDDLPAIMENSTIRQMSTALSPPNNATVAGRPLVNLTLAANYAWGGTDPWGYHLVNLTIHLSAALILFDLARRTPSAAFPPPSPQPSSEGRGRICRTPLAVAFAGALWWAVHPLQTESVTYVVQRAESLCGLLYLTVLYCLLRGAQSARSGAWYGACALACWLGMATKEVMATAPAVALIYDRVFLAGSFRQAWRDRKGLYAALAASWLLLAYLVLGTGGRSGSAGFHHQITPIAYAATQAGAILGYLRLSVWPAGLVFDYGRQTVGGLHEALPAIVAVAGLLLASLWALRRRPSVGFLAVAFFVILAPSSSIVPVATQTIAEHRMYLPLAAVTVGLGWALFAFSRRLEERRAGRAKQISPKSSSLVGLAGSSHPTLQLEEPATSSRIPRAFVIIALFVAALLGWQTRRRNNDYRTEESIWADTLTKMPENPRAWVNLARAHFNEGDARQALQELTKAVELDPDYADARVNRGIAYQALGALDDARHDFDQAIALEPDVAGHYFRRGVVSRLLGRTEDAIADYQKAVQLQPALANAWFNLGNLYANLKQDNTALECYSRTIEVAPQFANAWKNRAALLGRQGQYQRAIDDCTRAIALAPHDPDLYRNRSVFYHLTGREAEARRDLQTVGELAAASRAPPRDRFPGPVRRVE
jgi:tetratricopeptide (TPR) repeat protein